MAAAAVNRKKFAVSAVHVLLAAGLDGIDIDWEYPCIDSAGIEASPDDKYNFTYMLAALREELDTITTLSGNRPMLTIAVGAGEYFINNTETERITGIVDYISIMTYDMRGSWSKITGHHTNLLKPENGDTDPASAEHSVKIFEDAGMPRNKIVIGAAFYSRKWEKVKNEGNGYLQPSEGTGGFGPSYTDLYENFINKNGYISYWDDTAKAPYLFNGSTFISYDNIQSVEAKCNFIKDNNLLGIMYWEHDCDKTGQLLDAIDRILR
jgi:chitinase